MTKINHKQKILFLSTYPPAKCGIASFTQDLTNAVQKEIDGDYIINICALDKKNAKGLYSSPVTMIMDGHILSSVVETAGIINNDTSIALVCIEHEFGLYGGEMGEFLLGFIALLEKPFIIRFHTVLPSPDAKRLKIVQSIALLADRVMVMTNHSAWILKEYYGIEAAKIAIIPHGTHTNSVITSQNLKIHYNLADKMVLTTFGLLSPNKGIEKGILAMKEISVRFPETVYVVLGQTHPNLLEQEGEKYRNFLKQLIDDNHLQQNVMLINEYVPTQKLMEYLALTDIYLFTSKDPDQAMSGTFLYAMSAGCPIISNSFVLAKEMLDDETGIILQTNDPHELSENVINLLHSDKIRIQMGQNAFMRTRETTWEKVAARHKALFAEVLEVPILSTTMSAQFST